jgi:hypothetical protein
MRPGLWLRLAPSTTAWLREHQIGELSARLRLAEIEGRPQSTGAVQTLLGVPLAVPPDNHNPRCPRHHQGLGEGLLQGGSAAGRSAAGRSDTDLTGSGT